MNLGESFTLGYEQKILLKNEFSGNENIINFKIYHNYGDIYSLKENWEKFLERDKGLKT